MREVRFLPFRWRINVARNGSLCLPTGLRQDLGLLLAAGRLDFSFHDEAKVRWSIRVAMDGATRLPAELRAALGLTSRLAQVDFYRYPDGIRVRRRDPRRFQVQSAPLVEGTLRVRRGKRTPNPPATEPSKTRVWATVRKTYKRKKSKPRTRVNAATPAARALLASMPGLARGGPP